MNFIEDHVGWFIFIFVVLAIVAIILLFKQDAADSRRFMTECMKDKKEYECVAMWRAGQTHTAVMPLPIVIPMR